MRPGAEARCSPCLCPQGSIFKDIQRFSLMLKPFGPIDHKKKSTYAGLDVYIYLHCTKAFTDGSCSVGFVSRSILCHGIFIGCGCLSIACDMSTLVGAKMTVKDLGSQ